eukprot:gnl/MRDRNA2_/MRDRNA2_58469_c0_seq2.p1 gnl/MRDRNA2_/MRDRNA2_58469_c0~~gnl/MRDRNA2_/MRDRNA2_58469_c0_seq2.p1  ORF type:complete len:149 (-),score=22.57 gnl/MRDRNA2_/MRDRNA2_58469_c0_seq2:224-670(-)
MAYYESIHNDTREPVYVFWRHMADGSTWKVSYNQMLAPDSTTTPGQMPMNLQHQLCVGFTVMQKQQFSCKDASPPQAVNQCVSYQATDIIASGTPLLDLSDSIMSRRNVLGFIAGSVAPAILALPFACGQMCYRTWKSLHASGEPLMM